MIADDFGERMRGYESVETGRRLDVSLPVYARIDGRGFSKFTRGMERPFDARMSAAMISTASLLVERNHAAIGYTQSDEISLLFLGDAERDILFNGRVQKLVSVLAALATTAFYRSILATPGLESYAERMPHFDCRVLQLPSKEEAANMLLWRERDAQKNAVSMAAQHHFSHKTLQGKSTQEMRTMLSEKDVEFEDYPAYFKRGTFLRRVTEERSLTDAERMAISEAHRPPADAKFLRSSVKALAMPDFVTVTNRKEVIFDGVEPEREAVMA